MGTEFAILGELEVRRNGDRLELGSSRQRALLARLLISPNEAVSMDRLIDDFWRGDPPDQARHGIHVYMSRLRKALGPDGDRLERYATGYRIRIQPDELDSTRFERLAAEGRRELENHRAHAALDTLTRALGMWRGSALADFTDDPFARSETVRLNELRLDTFEQRVWADLECGRHDVIVAELRDTVARHPFRETCWEQLMLALYRSGRQADALRAYQSARSVLGEELGLEPGPALRAMEDLVLAQDPGISYAPIPGDRSFSQLPLQRTSFIGRDRELSQVNELLETSRLLTLIGAPGSGKTRIAIHLLDIHKERFPHGRYFVALAPIAEPQLVPKTIAHVLGLPDRPAEAPIARTTAFLRDRTALLVLDNFEHLLPAAAEVGVLLDSATDLRIVVTSRCPLGIAGEQVYVVPPLSVPPTLDTDYSTLAGYDAIALFAARARASDPDFTLKPANAPAIAEIARRLDGLALAIELAAARSNLMTPRELLGRLTQRLLMLTGGPTDADARHHTMRDAIAWSYELLNPDQQAVFRRLGVFVGGFTLDAACVLADLSDTLTLACIDSLLSGSLLHRTATAGETRYAMLETIREYALERLTAAGEIGDTRDRHLQYCLQLAKKAEPLLTSDSRGAGLQQLDADVDNIRAALRYALEADRPDIGMELANRIWRFWQGSDRLTEGRVWLERLLPHDDVSDSHRAAGLSALAGIAYWQADYREASTRYAEALNLYRSMNEDINAADTLVSMSLTATWDGDLETGARLAEESRSLFDELGSRDGMAKVLTARGFIRLRNGDYAGGHADYSKAMAIARKLGDQHLAITALPGIAACAFHEGNLSEALTVSLQAATEALEAHNTHLAVWNLDLVAAFAAAEDPEAATRLAGAADQLRHQAGGGMLVESLGLTNARDTASCGLSASKVDAAWSRGRCMSLEAAADLARELCGSLAPL